jgi:sugar lactone lactonase YvrE
MESTFDIVSWVWISVIGLAIAGGAAAASSGQVETLAEVAGGTGGLVMDAAGNLYSADFGAVLGDPTTAGTRIYKITSGGETSVFAEGFEGASGIAIDSKGNVFQSNIRGGYISKISPAGEVSTFASEGIESPVGIVIDEQDTLWVANCGGASIQKVTREGVSTRFVDSELLKCPNGITLDEDGNLYAANFYNGDVVKVTPAGEASVLATLPGNNNGHIAYAEGSLYVVARAVHQVYEVSLSGDARLFAGSGEKGGKDGPRLEATFCFPNDIAVGRDGQTLYLNEIADEESTGKVLAPTRVRILKR